MALPPSTRTASRVVPEVEVSLTASCTLACSHCGFFVPHQPPPQQDDVVAELADALACLERAGIEIGSLAVLGGEATLAPWTLREAIHVAASSEVVRRIEVNRLPITAGVANLADPKDKGLKRLVTRVTRAFATRK